MPSIDHARIALVDPQICELFNLLISNAHSLLGEVEISFSDLREIVTVHDQNGLSGTTGVLKVNSRDSSGDSMFTAVILLVEKSRTVT
jgi:hypothetical protein